MATKVVRRNPLHKFCATDRQKLTPSGAEKRHPRPDKQDGVNPPLVNRGSTPSRALVNVSPGTPQKTLKLLYYIGLDYLEITITGLKVPYSGENLEQPAVNSVFPVPSGHIEGEVRLIFNQGSRRNKHFQFGFDVLFIPDGAPASDNIEAMTVEYGWAVISHLPPNLSGCLDGSSILQVLNHRFYQSGFWQVMDSILAAIGANVAHITRLDIALDGKELLKPATDYYADVMEVKYGRKLERELDKVGKATYNTSCWTEVDRRVTNFYVGAISSSKVLNGYEKGVRMYVENKLYIHAAWVIAGLISPDDDGKEVHRLEFRGDKEAVDNLRVPLEGDGENATRPFGYYDLRDPELLAGAFEASTTGFYGFYKVNPKNKDKSRWEQIEVVDWSAIPRTEVNRVTKTKRSSETWKAKHAACKFIWDASTSSYLQEAATEAVTDYVADYSIPTEIVENFVWGASLEMPEVDKTELNRVARLFGDQVLEDFTGKLIDDVIDELPTTYAWAMAQEHHTTNYLARRIAKGYKGVPLSDKLVSNIVRSLDGKITEAPMTTEEMTAAFEELNQKLNHAGSAAAGLPLPDFADPATCDASTKGFPDPIKLTEGMGLVKGQPQPKTTDLQSREPGNKKGVLHGMPDGPIASPQMMAQ